MARLRLFANLREAAGAARVEIPGDTVGEVLDHAVARFGNGFGTGLASAQVWVNGEQAEPSTPVAAADEVALIPPVSGGQVTFEVSTLYNLAVGGALAVALVVANYVSLQVFVFVTVATAMAWVWDTADTATARRLPLNVFPPLVAAALAGNAAYRWGFDGFAIAAAAAAMVALVWAVFDSRFRSFQSLSVTAVAGLAAGLGVGALVLVRMRSVEETTALVGMLAAGVAVGWAAMRYAERIGWIDQNLGVLVGALAGGVAAGLVADSLDLPVMLLVAVAGAAGLIAGRVLGSLVRTGHIRHTAQAPGLLTAFDGPMLAAALMWSMLIIFG